MDKLEDQQVFSASQHRKRLARAVRLFSLSPASTVIARAMICAFVNFPNI
jgi:hypothetical protein